MRRRFFSTGLSIICVLVAAGVAQAQAQQPYRGTYQSVRQLILRIENRSANFITAVQSTNPNDRYATNEDITVLARDYGSAVRRLANNFARRRSTALDAQDVLTRADRIDNFLRQRPLDARTQNIWSSIRVDLNQLARTYNVSWPQTGGSYPPYGNPPYGTPGRFANRLTGTFRLDMSRSDDARAAADRATQNLAASERARVREIVAQRLQAPDQIALDVRGRTVTIASTRAAQITFDADGQDRTETNANGRPIHARASLIGQQLTVSSTGDTGNDFSVTFEPIDNGQGLNVTRQVYVQGLTRPIVVRSSYTKTDQVARFDIFNNQTYPGQNNPAGGFVVPDGTIVVGTLDGQLSTRTATVGDRFTLRVNQPTEFEAATIEGHVSNIQRSGRLTGRSVMTLDFDNIRLRDGRSYRFAGLVQEVH